MGGNFQKSEAIGRMEPWTEQQPYLSHAYGQSRDLYNKGIPAYYPGQQVASFNPLQQEAFGQIQSERLGSDFERQAGSHLINYANNPHKAGTLANDAGRQLQATVRGGGFNQNPWLDQAFQQAADQVSKQYNNIARPSRNLQFARAGRSGSVAEGAANQQDFDQYVKTMGGLASGIYGGAYQQERERQYDAARYGADAGRADAKFALGQVPTMSGLMNDRTDRFMQLGDRVQEHSQQQIEADKSRFNYYQQAPREMLDWYANLILGNQATQNVSDSTSKGYGVQFR